MHAPLSTGLLLLLVWNPLAPCATAQSVLHVGGASGSFLDIQSAVSAAAPGDLVLVEPGEYQPFVIDGKGLQVRARLAGTAQVVRPPSSALAAVTVSNLAAGQSVTLEGLLVREMFQSPLVASTAVHVHHCDASVFLQDVQVEVFCYDTNTANPQVAGLRVEHCLDVVLSRVAITGNPDCPNSLPGSLGAVVSSPVGVWASDAKLAVYDSILSTSRKAPGLLLQGADAFLTNSVAKGGDGWDGQMDTFFSSCVAEPTPGGPGADLQPGIAGGSASTLELLASELEGGAGGQGAGSAGGVGFECPAEADGPDLIDAPGSQVTTYDLKALSTQFPLTSSQGTLLAFQFSGIAGELVGMVISPAPGMITNSLLVQTLQLANPKFVLPLGFLADPSGSGTGSLTSSETFHLPIGFEALTFYVQSFAVTQGSQIVLGAPAHLAILGPGI